MPVPALSAVARSYGSTTPLKDGTVRPSGFELQFTEVPVLVHAFRRMVRELAFDVCEMAFSTYLCAREHGVPLTAIPVFPFRGFHHGAISVRAEDAGTSPRWLEGRRVGVNRGWTVTTGVWARGILAHEYGVDLSRVTWMLSGDEHVAAYEAPPNVVRAPSGSDLVDLLLAGEIDAIVGGDPTDPRVRPLLDDPDAAARTALTTRGFYPINHLVVIRDDVLAAYPQAASAVFEAFDAARETYVREIVSTAPYLLTGQDLVLRQVFDLLGKDPLPYGVEANRESIDQLIALALEQQVVRTRVGAEQVFAPVG